MLEISDFDQFYSEVTGHDPYPWQRGYAAQLCTQGWPEGPGWADRVARPTGAGKTEGVLLPWLFALAFQLDQGQRKLPLRLFWTVDRRIIVDEVSRLGEKIAEKLATPSKGSLCARVAKALGKTGSKQAFQNVKMRGGIFMDPSWMMDPRTPTLISTTVDQVGSGLLFRKYGSRNWTWPIYAGLLANDAAVLLDESHLSQPFVETLESIKRQHPKGLTLLQVSATTRDGGSAGLTDADRNHPVLGPRLRCPKVPVLVPCLANKLEKTLEAEAKKLGKSQIRIVAIVCNRVKTARKTFNLLRKDKKSDAVLFTGRSRQFDRDALTEELLPYIRTDAARPARSRTLYIVATQCIEAGADFDFDAMVTECAPLDCLIQRTGRLGRLGNRDVELVIVQGAEDPVYDDQSIVTWEWLGQQSSLDFSWEGQVRMTEEHGAALGALMSPSQTAPYLSCDIVKTLSRTSPPAQNAPTLERFLHGYNRSPDVTVLWRKDLSEADPVHSEMWGSIVGLCPPVPGEAIQMPIWTVRAFLGGNDKPDDMADVSVTLSEGKKTTKTCAPVLRWCGTPEDSALVTDPEDIRPGDILIFPASRGGCDEFGWTGDSNTIPEDVADKALRKSGKLRLRIHPSLYEDGGPLKEDFEEISRRWDDDEKLDKSFVRELLGYLEEGEPFLASSGKLLWEPYPDGKGFVVFTPKGRPSHPRDDGDRASHMARQVTLDEHLSDVGHWARIYSESLLDDPKLKEDFELTGLLHDLGKADPRFQTLLHGKAWSTGEAVLAKSSKRVHWNPANLPIPKGYRHEFSSLMMAEVGDLLNRAHDSDLVAHLLVTHHGRGRPFAPPLHDDNPVSYSYKEQKGETLTVASSTYPYAKLDSGWSDRYATTAARYGPWEIAYLEAILRVADWRASDEERKSTDA